MYTEKINKITALSLFLLECSWPVCFYFAYIHCGNILKDSFNYTPAEVIHQNLGVSMIELLASIILTYLSYKIYPLKILKAMSITMFTFILFCPYFLYNIPNIFGIFLIQSFVVALAWILHEGGIYKNKMAISLISGHGYVNFHLNYV